MKRLASFLLALCMAFSMAAPAFADNSNEAVIPSFSVNEPVAPEAESVPAEDESTAPEAESVPVEDESTAPEAESVPAEDESTTPEAESVPAEEIIPAEELVPAKETVPAEELVAAEEIVSEEAAPELLADESLTAAQSASAYLEVTEVDQITDGVYLIAACTGNKGTILYNVKNSNKSDQVTGDLTDNELKLASGFTENCQTWTINHKDAGFTIQGKDSNTFVNINSATNQTTRVPLSSTEQVLTISKVEGGFNIGRTVGNKTFYVHHADKQQYDIQETATTLRIFKQTAVIAGMSDLKAAVKKAEDRLANAADFTEESKTALTAALNAAKDEIKNVNATEDSVRTALNTLNKAMQAMVPVADKIAPGAPKNDVTHDQPFPVGMAGSDTFRIPAITTLKDGSLAAAIDARWDNCPDGYGIDTLFSISKDNGKTWEYTFPNFFNDSTNVYDVKEKKSASFIDPVMVQDKDGTIYLMTDVFPGGNYILTVDNATGYERIKDELRLVLYTSPNKGQNSSNYSYYVGDFETVEGMSRKFAPVIDKNNESNIAYYVDDHYYLYTADKKPMYCRQIGSDKYVEQNVFFYNADLHVRNATYLWLVTSKDNGQTWSAPTIMNPMVRPSKDNYTHRFYGVGPGAGLALDDGTVMLTCYVNDARTPEKSSFIYTNDQGATWHRSDDATVGGDWSSESTMVQIDDKTVRQFCRDNYNVLRYTDHVWNGTTWERSGNPVEVKDAPKTAYNQLSAIRYSKLINGKPAIMVSTATMPGRHRTRGKIYTFTLNDDKTMSLIGSYQITKGGTSKDEPGIVYGYSSLTELSDGSIGLLYEETFKNSKYINIPVEKLVPGAVVDGQRTVEVPLYGTYEATLTPAPSADDLKAMDSSIATAELKDGKVIFTGVKEGTTSFINNGITTNIKVVSTYPTEQVKLYCNGEHKITIGAKNTIVNHNEDIIATSLEPVTVTGGQGTTGTDKNYSGKAESLATALYTFHQDGDRFQVSAPDAEGTMTWVDPTAANGFPFGTQAASVKFVPNDNGTFFLLGGESRYLYFWPNNKDQYSYDAVSKTEGFVPGCSFKLYRPVNENETSSTELPGYVATTEIKDGGKYLIVSQVNGGNYVMRPSTDSSNRYSHVLKADPNAEKVTTTVENVLTFKAQGKAGTANVLVDGTVYQVTVEHKLTRVERVEATADKPGNILYWHCEICGKNFLDAAGTQPVDNVVIPAGTPLVPIKPSTPVTPEKPDTPLVPIEPSTPVTPENPSQPDNNTSDNNSSNNAAAPATSAPTAAPTGAVATGDVAHLGLWLIVVALAGAGIGGITYLRKRKDEE